MGELYPAKGDEARAVRRVHILAPFRAGIRFAGLIAWTLACFVALVCVSLLGRGSGAVSRKARGAVSRVWEERLDRVGLLAHLEADIAFTILLRHQDPFGIRVPAAAGRVIHLVPGSARQVRG